MTVKLYNRELTSIELSSSDIQLICKRADEMAALAMVEYRRMRETLSDSNATSHLSNYMSEPLNDDAIRRMALRIEETGYGVVPEGDSVLYFCTVFENVHRSMRNASALLMIDAGNGSFVHSMFTWSTGLFQPLGVLHRILSSRLSPSSINQEIARMRKDAASRLADIRHSQPGGSRDMRKHMLASWATGNYESRDECADKECDPERPGWSREACRKALRGSPEPVRRRG